MIPRYGMQIVFVVFASLSVSGTFAWDKVLVDFDGASYVTYGLPSKKSTIEDHIKFLFHTIKPSGLILHAGSSTGDFITIELLRSKLRYSANLGTTTNSSGFHEIFMGNNLADNQWHQVELTRTGKNVLLKVDVTRYPEHIPGSYATLDLDTNIYVAGVDDVGIRRAQSLHNRRLPFTKFEGCLQDVTMNSDNILKKAKDGDANAEIHGRATFGCPMPKYRPVTFPNPQSHIKVPIPRSKGSLQFGFKLRTYDAEGVLASHHVQSSQGADISLSLVSGRIKLEVEFRNPRQLVTLHAGDTLDDDMWHSVAVSVSGYSASLKVDGEISQHELRQLRREFVSNPFIYFGGTSMNLVGFVGCMYEITVQLREVNVSSQRVTRSRVRLGQCTLVDHCLPNPCQNRGRCTQRLNDTMCDCTGTNFKGRRCEVPAYMYKETCADWKTSGFTVDGDYTISPGNAKTFKVYCNMSNVDGPSTVIDHVWGRAQIKAVNPTSQPKGGFFLHPVQYEMDLANIGALISRSTHCRQYLRYNCFRSVLIDSLNPFDLTGGRGARWMSRNGKWMDYWAGASPGSHKCACGMTNTCARHNVGCNCDARDPVWRTDGGYITDMKALPVRNVIFSVLGTSTSSNFTLGSLECFGSKTPTTKTVTLRPTMRRPDRNTKRSETSMTKTSTKSTLQSTVAVPKTIFIPHTEPTGTKTNLAQAVTPTTETDNNIPDSNPTTYGPEIDYNNPPPIVIIESPRKYITIRQNNNQELILIVLSVILAVFIIAIIVLMVRQNLFIPCKCLDGPVYRDVRNIDSIELGPPSSLFTNVDTEILEYEASPFPPRNFDVEFLNSPRMNSRDIVSVQSRGVPRVARADIDSDEETERLDFSNDSSPSDSQTDGKDELDQGDSKEQENGDLESLKMAPLKSPQPFVDGIHDEKLKEALYEVISASEVSVNNNPVAKERKQRDTSSPSYEGREPNQTINRYGMDFLRPPSYRDIDNTSSTEHASRSDSELSLSSSTRSSPSFSCDEASDEEGESTHNNTHLPSRNDALSPDNSHTPHESHHIHLNPSAEDIRFQNRSRFSGDLQYYCSYDSSEVEDPRHDSVSHGESTTFLDVPHKRTREHHCGQERPEFEPLLSQALLHDEQDGLGERHSSSCERNTADCECCERFRKDSEKGDSFAAEEYDCSMGNTKGEVSQQLLKGLNCEGGCPSMGDDKISLRFETSL